MHVVKVSIGLIIFATLGLTAIVLLATSSTSGLTGSTAFLATTFVILMAVIGVALDFVPGGLGSMAFNTAPSSRLYQLYNDHIAAPSPQVVVIGAS